MRRRIDRLTRNTAQTTGGDVEVRLVCVCPKPGCRLHGLSTTGREGSGAGRESPDESGLTTGSS
jgi:hypothetical protein